MSDTKPENGTTEAEAKVLIACLGCRQPSICLHDGAPHPDTPPSPACCLQPSSPTPIFGSASTFGAGTGFAGFTGVKAEAPAAAGEEGDEGDEGEPELLGRCMRCVGCCSRSPRPLLTFSLGQYLTAVAYALCSR